MLEAFEEVPTPDFHHWNNFMGIAHHNLGNIGKAKEFFEKVKLVYGDNPFDTLKGAQEMWNGYSIHLEREKIFYKEVYGW